MKKAFVAALFVFCLAPFIVFAGGQSEKMASGPSGSISVLSFTKPTSAMQEIVKQFETKYPGVHVNLSDVNSNDVRNAIETYLTSSNPPDVIQWFAGLRTEEFAKNNLLVDISDVWKQNNWESVVSKGFQRLSQYQGKYIFAPTDYAWWAVYYRKDIFKKVGV